MGTINGKKLFNIMLLSLCLCSAGSALAWHGGGGGAGGWHGGGGGWHGGGWHGGGWHGGGWHGNVYNINNGWNGVGYGIGIYGYPYYYPYNYYNYSCNIVQTCDQFGNCWERTVCN